MNSNPIYVVGEVLFDIFPDGTRILGGAPFNVAWHLQGFGLEPRFISRIGLDPLGEAIIKAMREWQIAATFLQRDSRHATGSVQITLTNGDAEYHILPDQAYDFIDLTPLTLVPFQGLLYHGSLALRNPEARAGFFNLLEQHQGQRFFDVNLRAPWWQIEVILDLIKHADWVKMNAEEFEQLSGTTADVKENLQNFMNRYGIGNLLVTLGAAGAVLLDASGRYSRIQPPAKVPIVDTVGAGDAFSAVVMLGLQSGWPVAEMLARAQEFAIAIVAQRGAIVLDRRFYENFKTAWAM